MNIDALKDLLLRMADDSLIIGHRNSEWTGLGPIIEEDIAFSSIAQDKIGHSLALYTMLEKLGEPEPDINAFTRNEKDFRCCRFVEYPIGEYDFSLMRHFLFDNAEYYRYQALEQSSFHDLAALSRKIRGEVKYHVFHANTWIESLAAKGTETSKARMQAALNECMPMALGMFERSAFEAQLIEDGIFVGEAELEARWLEAVTKVVEKAGLVMPNSQALEADNGGRRGYHTEHLQPMLDEMAEVFREDPQAEW